MSRHNLAVVYVCVRASACHIYSLFVHAGGWASISLTRTFSLSHDLSLSLPSLPLLNPLLFNLPPFSLSLPLSLPLDRIFTRFRSSALAVDLSLSRYICI